MKHRAPIRAVGVALFALAIVVGSAAPAAAHAVEGAGPTNYLTELEEVRSKPAGVEFAVLEFGNRLELRNATRDAVIVVGYEGEPYLRVGPDGVEENRRSPAKYLNADRLATTPVPEEADPKAEPEWQRISEEPVARWHDHRVHWMGEEPPDFVEKNPGREQEIFDEWEIPMTLGDREFSAVGNLRWVPAPSPVPWLAIVIVVIAGIVGGALTSRWYRALAVGAFALVVVTILQSIGIAWAPGTDASPISRLAEGSLYLVPAWGLGLFGAQLLWRGNRDGGFAVLISCAMLGVIGGLMDLGVLFSSQIAFAASPNVARMAVALVLGLAIGVIAGDVVAFAKHEKPTTDTETAAT